MDATFLHEIEMEAIKQEHTALIERLNLHLIVAAQHGKHLITIVQKSDCNDELADLQDEETYETLARYFKFKGISMHLVDHGENIGLKVFNFDW